MAKRKKKPTTKRRTHVSDLTIGKGGKLKVRCPIHNNEILHRLVYNTAISKRPTKTNKRGIVGIKGQTDWFYCEKCDKPRKIRFIVAK